MTGLAANLDLVAKIFGPLSVPARIVYLLVAVSAIYQLLEWNAVRKRGAAAACQLG